PTPLAHANYIADPIPTSCEFGIIIDDKLQGQGIGYQLMTHLIAHAKAQGHTLMRAEILADNHPMQKLALKLGFTLNKHPRDNGLVEAKLHLM
ncbi:GNAT family N-acetyltransferase, partial [Kingella oralis]